MNGDSTPKLMVIITAAILLYVFAHVFVKMKRDECVLRPDNTWRYKFSGLDCTPTVGHDLKKPDNPVGVINPNAGQDL